MTVWVGIALLGGLGAATRHVIETLLDHDRGLLVVNLIGCAAIGALAGAGVGGDARRVLAVGFLGGLTTFSGWALEDRRDGAVGLVLCLAACALARALT